jgi:hypothetical protein
MATGLFGNKYQQAVDNEAIQRQQLSQTGGLTGWAAITQAMGGLGGELGYQGGQLFGGQTSAQVQQANYQAVIDSVPNFDPMDPASLQEMSSAMWQGGFYDEGMAFMDRSQDITSANLQNDLIKSQLEPKEKELTVTEQIAQDKADRIAAGAELVRGMPRTTSADMLAVADKLEDAGYTDIPEYKNLRSNIVSTQNIELQVGKEETTNEEQQAKIERDARLKAMGEVMDAGQGQNIVGGVFLRDKPDTGSVAKTEALERQIGGILQVYDGRLSNRGLDSKVTPGEAYPYYEKVFNLPEVYQGNSGWDGTVFKKSYDFDANELNLALDTIFGVGDLFVPQEKLKSYLDNGLLIPGVTNVFNVSTGKVEVYNP